MSKWWHSIEFYCFYIPVINTLTKPEQNTLHFYKNYFYTIFFFVLQIRTSPSSNLAYLLLHICCQNMVRCTHTVDSHTPSHSCISSPILHISVKMIIRLLHLFSLAVLSFSFHLAHTYNKFAFISSVLQTPHFHQFFLIPCSSVWPAVKDFNL